MKDRILVITEQIKGGEWIAVKRLISALKSKHPMRFEYLILKKRVYSQKHFGFLSDHIKYYLYSRDSMKTFIGNKKFNYIFVSDYIWALSTLGVKHKKTKLIFMFHGLRSIPFKILADFDYKQVFTKMLERLAWILSDAITVSSKFGYDYILKTTKCLIKKRKFFLVRNIVPELFFSKPLNHHDNNNFNILYSGRLAKQKGLENLIVAFSIVISKIPNANLLIAYPNSSVDPYIKHLVTGLVEKYNLNHKIKFFKDSTETRLQRLYSRADVFVLPSEFEMAPLSVLEAMATGTPIIATDVGNVRELLNKIDTNLILKNNSPEEIHKKLLMYYSYNKHKKILLSKKMRSLITNYTEKQAVKDFSKVLNFLSHNNSL